MSGEKQNKHSGFLADPKWPVRRWVPVEAVHHFEVHPQVLLGEVVQHASVHQALHEVAAVLR